MIEDRDVFYLALALSFLLLARAIEWFRRRQ